MADLTQEQQDMIVKVAKEYLIVTLAVMIPFALLAAYCTVSVFAIYRSQAWLTYDSFVIYAASDFYSAFFVVICVVMMAYVIISYIFIRVRYPLYSDAKYKCIKKMRKMQNK